MQDSCESGLRLSGLAITGYSLIVPIGLFSRSRRPITYLLTVKEFLTPRLSLAGSATIGGRLSVMRETLSFRARGYLAPIILTRMPHHKVTGVDADIGVGYAGVADVREPVFYVEGVLPPVENCQMRPTYSVKLV